MTDQELLKKLNNLKSIKPDNDWQKEYRDILFSQISAGQPELEPKSDIRIVWESIMPRQILMSFAKPVWLASIASVLILVVGIGGVYASKNTKPGDSLYIAKIISERAQFAMTFDEKDKAKLGVEFATNRAKEMIQVLEDKGQTATVNNDKLEKLSQNFKKEISQVKNRLSVIKAAADQAKSKEAESEVFGANLGKNNQRLEISESATPVGGSTLPTGRQAGQADGQIKPTPIVEPVASTSKPILENQIAADSAGSQQATATSTAENANSAGSAGSQQAGQMLDEAEKLVDEKNLNGAIDKLGEINKVINQTEVGQVEGASETASSTQ
ncbi:MAG: DUF5667 domain-containing protein [bacterium]|nr:DUF5667 domain-containing protein [bacterium]